MFEGEPSVLLFMAGSVATAPLYIFLVRLKGTGSVHDKRMNE